MSRSTAVSRWAPEPFLCISSSHPQQVCEAGTVGPPYPQVSHPTQTENSWGGNPQKFQKAKLEFTIHRASHSIWVSEVMCRCALLSPTCKHDTISYERLEHPPILVSVMESWNQSSVILRGDCTIIAPILCIRKLRQGGITQATELESFRTRI